MLVLIVHNGPTRLRMQCKPHACAFSVSIPHVVSSSFIFARAALNVQQQMPAFPRTDHAEKRF
ncbi:hypothetical protein PQQ63_38810, partial [Paraburkholderia metrosideri]